MADHALEDPVQARARELEARREFARALDDELAALRVGLRLQIIQRFETLLAEHTADAVLLQLVREAYDYFEAPESRTRHDIEAWVKTARPFVR